MDKPYSFESYTSFCFKVATGVRNGILGMPDVSKLELDEARFLLMLIKDDAFYDFWSEVAGKSKEYLAAIKEVAEAQEAFEKAEEELKRAEYRYVQSIKKLRQLNPAQELN